MTNILTPTYPERRGENEADRYEAEAAQTILGPVPLSVAIATTLKQLREECADLFDGDELPDTKAPKITLPGASSEAPMGLPQELARREERVLNIARALAEGCALLHVTGGGVTFGFVRFTLRGAESGGELERFVPE